MARRLQKRCGQSQIHQQLVGGRCKDAAYYPLPPIRAMLRGMHDTTMAQGKDRQELEEMTQTLNAISDHPIKLPEIIATTNEVKSTSIRKWGGGYLNIRYDTRKPRYTDEYTGEMLRDELVQTAMTDKLAYFNHHVWETRTLDQMKTVADYMLVRSRWVMANKGESKDSDVRASLVGCEVNKGGEKLDAFDASTPPLEANQISSEPGRTNP